MATSIQFLDFVTLDVFTTTPYSGNPLALVRVPTSLRTTITKAQKQKIAAEFNLSETVFLHDPEQVDKPSWDIEIFDKTDELPFAGHPTIGAAVYAMGTFTKDGGLKHAKLRTKAGSIQAVDISDDKSSLRVQANVPHEIRVHRHTFKSLSLEPPWAASNEIVRAAELTAPLVSIVKGMTFMLIGLASLEDLASVEAGNDDLQLNALLDKEDGWNDSFTARYYYVCTESETTPRTEKRVVRTRMLEKGMEDPATGSAASALASYLALKREGKTFEIVQGVEMGRKSVIGVEVELHEDGMRCKDVKLSGTAVQIMEGKLRL